MSQINAIYSTLIINSLTGNAGGVINGDAFNNINVLGDTTTVNVTGNPATNTLTISATAAVPTTFTTDAGNAVPALNVLTVTGGTNIGTTGAGSTVTINLNNDILVNSLETGTLTSGLQITGTTIYGAGTDPNIDITITPKGTGVLNVGDVIANDIWVTGLYTGTLAAGLNLGPTSLIAAGTDADISINITAKGAGKVIIDDLNISDLTAGTLRSGATGDISSLADGADGTLLIGKTGDVPIWATLTDGNNITCTEGANSISIAVTGTTQYALQVGDATGSLDSLGIGTAGQILQSGGAAANPAWSTATYPSTVNIGDLLVASAADTITTIVPATAGYLLTSNGAGNAPTFQSAVGNNTTFHTDAGDAVESTDAITIAGGTNLNTAGAGATVTVNLDDTITLTTVNATTFDTNIAAAGLTLSGTELAADGTDVDISIQITPKGLGILETTNIVADTLLLGPASAGLIYSGTTIEAVGTDLNIDINLTAKGTGQVVIDDLNISGLTAGTLRSDATGDISSLADGSNGQLLIGKTGDVPIWATLTDGNNITCTEGANSIAIAVTGTTEHSIQIGSAAGSLTSIGVGTTGQILQANTTADPTWSTATYPSTTTKGDLLSASADNVIGVVTAGTTGQVLQAVTTDKPAYSTTTYPSTSTKGDIISATANNTFGVIAAGTTGQILQAVTSDKPAYSTATYPSTAAIGDVLVASAANTIGVVSGATTAGYLLTSNGAGTSPTFQAAPTEAMVWTEITDVTVSLVANNGYIMNRGTLITATLPSSCVLGKLIRIAGKGDGLTVIAQNASQMIHFSGSTTTTGVGGSLTATNKRDCLELLCVVADLEFEVVSSIGNWTLA